MRDNRVIAGKTASLMEIYCFVYLIALRAVNNARGEQNLPQPSSTHLVGKIVGVKNYFNVARFANKCLRLLRLTTEHSRLAAIRDICFGVAVYDLQNGVRIKCVCLKSCLRNFHCIIHDLLK